MKSTWKQIVNAVDRILAGESPDLPFLKRSFTGPARSTRGTHTEFEQQLLDCHRTYSRNPEYHALYVSIEPCKHGTHLYNDPVTQQWERGFFAISVLPKSCSLLKATHLEQNIGHRLVMMLDMHKSVESQIPDWEPGTIDFPDKFIANPVITAEHAAGQLAKNPYTGGIGIKQEIERSASALSGILHNAISSTGTDHPHGHPQRIVTRENPPRKDMQ